MAGTEGRAHDGAGLAVLGDRGAGDRARPGSLPVRTPRAVTAAQVRDVVDRLIAAGHWQPRGPDILLVANAGYDGHRLSHFLAELPIVVLVRMRSDRVLRRPVPP